MKKKSLRQSAILNGIRTIISIVFPLITFPYATRILNVVNLGKVTFSSSIMTYFALFAGLGIMTYAIREGSSFRDSPKKLNEFANQIFTINIISTLFSYMLLVITLFIVPSLKHYWFLLLIQCLTLMFTTIGIEWIYNIYEDYIFITLRSLAFQIIALILLFIFVKDTDDYYLYALIIVVSNVGSNLLNFIHSRKYIKLRLTKNLNLKKHLKPILIIFSNNIMSSIYVNSDVTMLGFMIGDYSVGIYSVAVKIYVTVKSIIGSVIIVAIPRLSFYFANNEVESYRNTLKKIFSHVSILLVPAVVGINLLSKELIILISGNGYLEAVVSLRILSIALIFSIFATIITSGILLPMKNEKYILNATAVSAIVNIGLNLYLIPTFKQTGAAFTTLLAELVVLIITYYYGRQYIDLRNLSKNIITSLVGCVSIFIVSFFLRNLISNIIIYTIATIAIGGGTYFAVLIFLKNEVVLELKGSLIKKLKGNNS